MNNTQCAQSAKKNYIPSPTVGLWEILIPTTMYPLKIDGNGAYSNEIGWEDEPIPVRKRHHKQWDKFVRNISGGLTVCKPAKGQWIHMGKLYEDRVIPVRIACTREQIMTICNFTMNHYRQKSVMSYHLSDEVVMFERRGV